MRIAHCRCLAIPSRHHVALAVLRERGQFHCDAAQLLAKVFLDDLKVLLACLRALRKDVQRETQALDQGGFAGAPASDDGVQMPGQDRVQAVQIAAADTDTVDGSGQIDRLLRVQSHPGLGIQKCDLEGVEARPGHLDPAGGRRVCQIFRLGDIARIDHRHRTLAPPVRIFVQDNLLELLRQIADRAGNLDSAQQLAVDPVVDSFAGQDAALLCRMRGIPETAQLLDGATQILAAHR